MRLHTERYAEALRDLQEWWSVFLGSLPEPDAAADRVSEWFRRQLEGPGNERA
jgi:hypothetical protein